MIGDERVLIDTIRKRQRKWIGLIYMSFAAKNGNPMKNGWNENKKPFIVSVILQQFLLYLLYESVI